jgi:hypothetical protein
MEWRSAEYTAPHLSESAAASNDHVKGERGGGKPRKEMVTGSRGRFSETQRMMETQLLKKSDLRGFDRVKENKVPERHGEFHEFCEF